MYDFKTPRALITTNRILKFNMELSCVAVALATCTIPAGIFGMNVIHGLEDVQWAFPVVVGGW